MGDQQRILILIQLLPHLPYGIRWAIPLHASNAMLHDQITRTKGSFEQTDQGIKNLLMCQQKVEIRINKKKKNLSDLLNIAKYIVQQYQGVFCVNLLQWK